jgi:glycosyltransferase involved in cell wall biosynthesis
VEAVSSITQKIMKICLYSPYIPKHFGGGELYLLQVAQSLLKDHEVFLAISEFEWQSKLELEAKLQADLDLKTETDLKTYSKSKTDLNSVTVDKVLDSYQSFFKINLSGLKIITTPIGSSQSWWKKWLWTRQWDVFYYLTDGSIFPSFAKNSILHIQVPLRISKKSFWEKFKLSFWNVINTNSSFTKNFVSKTWPIPVDCVHSPYVELPKSVANCSVNSKEKSILNVGRFFKQLHSKRQDVIIETFKKLVKEHPQSLKDWKLVLVGGVEDESYSKSLTKLSLGYPIEFYHNTTRDELLDWYCRASVYWHATGYGVDDNLYPEKVEHFGITTIEAMTAGCVPIVIKAGGQIELLGRELESWLWTTQEQWLKLTLQIIDNQQLRVKTAKMARERALNFSRFNFEKQLKLMIHKSY